MQKISKYRKALINSDYGELARLIGIERLSELPVLLKEESAWLINRGEYLSLSRRKDNLCQTAYMHKIYQIRLIKFLKDLKSLENIVASSHQNLTISGKKGSLHSELGFEFIDSQELLEKHPPVEKNPEVPDTPLYADQYLLKKVTYVHKGKLMAILPWAYSYKNRKFIAVKRNYSTDEYEMVKIPYARFKILLGHNLRGISKYKLLFKLWLHL